MKVLSLSIADVPDDTPRHRLGLCAEIESLDDFDESMARLVKGLRNTLSMYEQRAFLIEMRDWDTARKTFEDREAVDRDVLAQWAAPATPLVKVS